VEAAAAAWHCHNGLDGRPVIDNDVSIEELQKAVEHMHGVPARFVESVEVDERHEGKPVRSGAVKFFDLVGHPSAATWHGLRRSAGKLGHCAGAGTVLISDRDAARCR
jgi:hypothetical protein